MVKLCQADKLLDISLFLGTGPFADGTDKATAGMDTLFGDDMAKELGLFLHEGTLGQLGVEVVLAEKGEDRPKVLEVFGFRTGVDQEVVEVDYNPSVEIGI